MTAPVLHPLHRLVRILIRGFDIPEDVKIGTSLRTPGAVVAVEVAQVQAGTLVVYAQLPRIPTSACVLTIMVDPVARIDLPVHLEPADDGAFEATVDGVPLVIRRRVTVSRQLAEVIGAAA